MEGILKVTPEKLLSAASEFETHGQTVSSLTSEMLSLVNSLQSVWQGEAASGYSERFMSLQDDIMRIDRMIREHVDDLTQMAGEYARAEEESIEMENTLATELVN